jgi:hypothetical protein
MGRPFVGALFFFAVILSSSPYCPVSAFNASVRRSQILCQSDAAVWRRDVIGFSWRTRICITDLPLG